jgi:hypothetical protein
MAGIGFVFIFWVVNGQNGKKYAGWLMDGTATKILRN